MKAGSSRSSIPCDVKKVTGDIAGAHSAAGKRGGAMNAASELEDVKASKSQFERCLRRTRS